MHKEVMNLSKRLGPKYQVLCEFHNDKSKFPLVFDEVDGRIDVLIGKEGATDTAWVEFHTDGTWRFIANRNYKSDCGKVFKTAEPMVRTEEELVRSVWGRIRGDDELKRILGEIRQRELKSQLEIVGS